MGLACAASTHGLTDAMHPMGALWPYLLVLVPLPPGLTQVLFFAASTLHFGDDVGLGASLALHATLVSLSLRRRHLATALGCAYYIGVHVPLHLWRHWDRTPLARVALAGAGALWPWTRRVRRCEVPPVLQRLVVSHVGVDRVSRCRSRRAARSP